MLFPRSSLLLCLLVPALLVACAKEKEAPVERAAETLPAEIPVYKVPTEDLSTAQLMAKSATITCSGIGECSPSVGLLSFAEGKAAGQCSASLVAPDVVVTNSHCIPEELKAPGSNCRNLLWMNFAVNGSYETQIKCDKVIFAADISKKDGPDYAFIRLAEASTRPYLRTSHGGFAEMETYQLHKVNPNGGPGEISGSQMSVPCKAIYNSNFNPDFFNSLGKVASLTECEVIPGNSGGPVLDSSGAVRGVIFARFRVAEQEKKNRARPGFGFHEGNLVYSNLATNFACIKIGNERNELNPACSTLEAETEKNREKRDANYEATEQAVFRDTVRRQDQSIYGDFQWKMALFTQHADTDQLEYTAEPTCVNLSAVSKYASGRKISRPLMHKEISYDRYFRGKRLVKNFSRTDEKIEVTDENGTYRVRLYTNADEELLFIPACQ